MAKSIKMLDILGREINEHDIVVVKGNGSSYSSGPQKSMEIGIRMGNTIRTLTCARNPSDKFLVENPGMKELEIKDQILSLISSKKIAASRKSAARSTNKAIVPGTIYLMNRYNEIFLYLGKINVDSYIDGDFKVTKKGHVYVSLDTHSRDVSKYKSLTMTEVKDIISKRGISVWHVDEISCRFDIMTSTKSYVDILGTVTDFTKDFEIEYNCGCRINGGAPYEKGKYKFH